MEEKWHKHLGVYGICIQEGKILLINKVGGPYTNRYDLPGGRVEPNEPLAQALRREFKEETGISITVIENIGVLDYLIPFKLEKQETTHIHHIAIYYQVEHLSGELSYSTDLEDNDSVGVGWVDFELLTTENCSPLVMQALVWLGSKQVTNVEIARLDDWVIM
ncbi:NUDIX domain-containing protein [Paenibacillus psychroresistens]|uniref:NUDIX domain-containing protein n=1 Tax=Paenibacillus psychroresistens TaxID=1778678 RepID=A0A6B8RS37_9BACL|nr:NUDIX hydrolase [Paenibacillus psychroresistens]QGQ98707.1 NUDIX domain-containing protein [Paenibacillus psychroresistens]